VNLELSSDQQLLAETVRRFLAERAVAWVRTMLDDDRGVTDDVWSGLVELGVTDLLEAGDGGSMVDVGVVAMEMGRALFPGPWQSSAVGAATLLPDLDDRMATVAFDGLDLVADAAAADVVLMVSGQSVTALENFDVEPVGTVDGTRKWGRIRPREGGRALAEVDVALARDRVVAATVADGVGAAERPWSLRWPTPRTECSSTGPSAASRPCSTSAQTCCNASSWLGRPPTTPSGPATPATTST